MVMHARTKTTQLQACCHHLGDLGVHLRAIAEWVGIVASAARNGTAALLAHCLSGNNLIVLPSPEEYQHDDTYDKAYQLE